MKLLIGLIWLIALPVSASEISVEFTQYHRSTNEDFQNKK